ncbi:SusC/RagA family TonB-linked outer membrane protein [Sphingobacterium gobiense]|uniref:SusC/RagA family TonB-linked outer membrane protein n=1 Tax=Sphingobacterium gobiense TaxID=1382456 RepID=A0A2S9JD36_9SPHI|nr:TonB-dependent receptor [Sphingobacterium gobiense]PRD50788.1 SusC/RagA family TonB-linked outer membrane protein [Sphingobacterium gobiense]
MMKKIISLISCKLILFVLLCNSLAYAQQTSGLIPISGKVVNQQNEVLEGVSVSVKDRTTAVKTDAGGLFSLFIEGEEAVLVFSSLGYERLEITVGQQRFFNVILAAKSTALDDVVVIGYGETTRRDVTGSVGSVNMKDLAQAPVKSFDEALAGRVAGVTVTANDGQPGSNTNIVIRGSGSITQNTAPLYVVDGFPLEDANSNSINPGDIESIEILKDASATAIYGARGANGVIMITTKKGVAGKPVVNYNAYGGFAENPKPLKLMGAYEFVKYQYELEPQFTTDYYLAGRTLESYRDEPSIDLQDQIYKQAFVHNHELSVRGGSAGTTYSLSGNLLKNNGLVTNSGFDRKQLRFQFDQQLGKKLKIGTIANYSANKTYGIIVGEPSMRITYSGLSLLASVWGFRPVKGLNESLLEDLFDPTAPENDFRVNPILSTQNELRETFVNTLTLNGYGEYLFNPNLVFRSSAAYTNVMVRQDMFFNSLTANGNIRRNEGVNGSIAFRPRTTWVNENILTYKKSFKQGHTLNAVGGFSLQQYDSGDYGFQGLNVLNESLGIDGLDEAGTNVGFSSSSRWALMSFLGRFNYGYKNKYRLTSSFRYDGSSKFAPGKRWAFFPSAAFAWTVSEEDFLKDVSFLHNAKIRTSYGATGNNRVSDFPYITQLSVPRFGGYSFNNAAPTRGALLLQYGNPDLTWETTVQGNIGLDLSFWEGRIEFVADIYRRNTKDLLLDATLPYATGLTSSATNLATAYKNIGELRNQGLELTLNTTNIDNGRFKWSTNFNISFNQNKIIALNENQTALLSPVAFDTDFRNVFPYISVLDGPLAQMYGLVWDGVYQYNEFDQVLGNYVLKDYITTNGQPRENIQPGDIKYKDINGDLVVNEMDFTVIGRGLPIHVGGFTNRFDYKGFDLNVFFQWSYGNDILNANRLIFEGNAKRHRSLNQYASYENRWTPENPSNELFRTGGQRDTYYSSRTVEEGSFLRLKTVSVGYTFQDHVLTRLKVNSLRLYASAQNLHTWTTYSGSNPEVSVRHSALTPGFDFSAYPLARTITFGLTTTF